MPDVLTQGEVDALLAAVSASKKAGRSRGKGHAPAAEEVRFYDFLRPERASPSTMRALTELHETVARALAAALSGAVRAPVDCHLRSFEQAAWGEFVMELPSPTCFAVVEAAPAAGRLAFEIAPSVLHPVMEKLLGAPEGSAGDVPARPFTAIERRVAAGLVEIALGAAAEVLSRARPVELTLVQLESSPQAVPVAPPAEMAAVATFEISIAGHSGAAHLAMPFGSFGGLLEELASAGEVQPLAAAAGEGVAAAVRGAVGRVPVRLEAIAATLQMTLREIAELSAGKEITTSRGGTGDVLVSVGGLDRFSATEGEFRGRRAFRVTSRLTGRGGR